MDRELVVKAFRAEIEKQADLYLNGVYGGDERTQHTAYIVFRSLQAVAHEIGLTEVFETNQHFLNRR